MNKEMWNEGYEKGYADAMEAKRNQPTVIVDCGASYRPEEEVKISLSVTNENPDGSADAVVKFNKPAMECLIQWGLIKMIEKGLKTYAPVSAERRESGTDASSRTKGRSRAVAKATTRVASKTRKDTKARTRKV